MTIPVWQLVIQSWHPGFRKPWFADVHCQKTRRGKHIFHARGFPLESPCMQGPFGVFRWSFLFWEPVLGTEAVPWWLHVISNWWLKISLSRETFVLVAWRLFSRSSDVYGMILIYSDALFYMVVCCHRQTTSFSTSKAAALELAAAVSKDCWPLYNTLLQA